VRFASEDAFQRAVLDLAKMSGWKAHHGRGDMRGHIEGDAGFPDVVMARGGYIIIAEFKNPVRALTPAQHAWFKELGGPRGGLHQGALIVAVWRPEDWDDIVKILTGGR
jgi:hypothetical protein